MTSDTPTPENPIMPTNTYQGCECDQCLMNNTSCANCSSCGQDAETEMSSLGKAIFEDAKSFSRNTRVDRFI